MKYKHKCPLCPRKYQSKNDLRKHLKRIHGIDDKGKHKVFPSRKQDVEVLK